MPEGHGAAVIVCVLAENAAFSETQWQLVKAPHASTGTT